MKLIICILSVVGNVASLNNYFLSHYKRFTKTIHILITNNTFHLLLTNKTFYLLLTTKTFYLLFNYKKVLLTINY